MKKLQIIKVVKAAYGALMVLPAVAFAAPPPPPPQVLQGADAARPSDGPAELFGNGGFHAIANVLIFIIGAIAVLMIIVGGLRFVLSAGSSDGVKGAKNTILYAVIGLIVAILAYAIVNFVVKSFT